MQRHSSSLQVKFSRDGQTLGVASRDSRLYLYNVADWAAKGVCTGHRAPITHFDFSMDNNWIQTNCENFEILHFDANTGERNDSGAKELKDLEWFTWTCPLGFPVQGIHPPHASAAGGVLPTISSVHRNTDSSVLVSSSDTGLINVYRYTRATRTYPHTCNVGVCVCVCVCCILWYHQLVRGSGVLQLVLVN